MSRTVKETSLLAYVIAYLSEEQDRIGQTAPEGEPPYEVFDPSSTTDVRRLFNYALDAYEGGAR